MSLAQGQTYLVDDSAPTATGSGLMLWSNAIRSFDTALAMAVPGDTILVAHGIYRPTVLRDPADPRSKSFRLKGGVKVIGGYYGLTPPAGVTASTDPDSPDGFPQLTILTGDEKSDGRADDLYNVVVALESPYASPSENTIQRLARVTIRDGNASGGSEPYSGNGGGLYCGSVVPNVGPAHFGGRLELEEVIFLNNYAASDGGGLYYGGESVLDVYLSVARCYFSNNEAGERGGAIRAGKTGLRPGAGAGSRDGSHIVNCTFANNTAGLAPGSLLTFGGGAVYVTELDSVGSLEMTNNRVYGNRAKGFGGAYAFVGGGGNLRVANETIYGNHVIESPDAGSFVYAPAAVYFDSTHQASSQLYNSIIWGNTGVAGGGIGIASPAALVINVPPSIANPAGPPAPPLIPNPNAPTVRFCNIELHPNPIAGPPTAWFGDGNLNVSPEFEDPFGLDFRLKPTSPCIDAGSVSVLNFDLADLNNNTVRIEAIPYDFRANALFPRQSPLGQVDMGAFEQ